jgi:hypothetical protein
MVATLASQDRPGEELDLEIGISIMHPSAPQDWVLTLTPLWPTRSQPLTGMVAAIQQPRTYYFITPSGTAKPPAATPFQSVVVVDKVFEAWPIAYTVPVARISAADRKTVDEVVKLATPRMSQKFVMGIINELERLRVVPKGTAKECKERVEVEYLSRSSNESSRRGSETSRRGSQDGTADKKGKGKGK